MDSTPNQNASSASEAFGTVPQGSEGFGNVPKASETFRTLPHASALFGKVPHGVERKQNHSLTVREAARRFEMAGVARTERSIVNWCQANAQGVARLDAYYDPNERKYFITPQSVDLAIAEEQAKAAKVNAPAEPVAEIRNDAESKPTRQETTPSADNSRRVKELEAEVLDLKITNRGKDYFIEQLKQEREAFAGERKEFVAQLMNATRKVGELETRLLQLDAPRQERAAEHFDGSTE